MTTYMIVGVVCLLVAIAGGVFDAGPSSQVMMFIRALLVIVLWPLVVLVVAVNLLTGRVKR